MSDPGERTAPAPGREPADLAIVLSGGGALAAYQVGLLRCLGRRLPELRFPIVLGVSAGAINALFLAAHRGTLAEAASELSDLWRELTVSKVFRTDTPALAGNVLRWGVRLLSGGGVFAPEVRGLVDTAPLHELIGGSVGAVDGEPPGIRRNLEEGRLAAAALTTLCYTTGQTVTWVQRGPQGGGAVAPEAPRDKPLAAREQPHRKHVAAHLTVAHALASAALPLVFPAVRLGTAWYGDGGVRLAAPLAPVLQLGARRILAISTRHAALRGDLAERRSLAAYPPPAQILGQLMNAVFLDVLDEDAWRIEQLNCLIERLPPDRRDGLRPIQLRVLRPSVDLAHLAVEHEPGLPRAFRFLTRSLGTRDRASADFLSILMFQPDYLAKLIEVGESDAEACLPQIIALLES